MLKVLVAALAVVSLTACVQERDVSYEQALRVQLFNDCLARIPKGPEVTRYNDWDEVVQTCDNTAYYQSQGNTLTPLRNTTQEVTTP